MCVCVCVCVCAPVCVGGGDAGGGCRARRIAELRARAARSRFGDLYPLVRADFVAEVTEASKSAWVVVLLYQTRYASSNLALAARASQRARRQRDWVHAA